MTSAQEILAGLDAARDSFLFPDLSHDYYYYYYYYYAVDARLRACADQLRWALVIEQVGYNMRAGNLIDVVHFFGNCLTHGRQGYQNGDFLQRIDNMADVWDPDATDLYRGGVSLLVRPEDQRRGPGRRADLGGVTPADSRSPGTPAGRRAGVAVTDPCRLAADPDA